MRVLRLVIGSDGPVVTIHDVAVPQFEDASGLTTVTTESSAQPGSGGGDVTLHQVVVDGRLAKWRRPPSSRL
jgi:hypothetical protein